LSPMAMLDYSEITERKYIVFNGEPWEVLTSHVFRKQQRKPVNATKIKNLITGKVTEQSFHVSEKVEEAEIDSKDAKFLYSNRGEFWFCDPKDPSDRFKIEENTIGPQAKFLKKDFVIQVLSFGERMIGVKIPIKIDLKVTEAQPAVRGNTAQGGTKTVKLETGAEINVPMFIKEGETIRVNTETGEYAERVGGNSF
jgi:elongation factor P